MSSKSVKVTTVSDNVSDSSSANDISFSCAVCLSLYSDRGNIPRVLKCGHTFCTSCLYQIPTDNGSFPCPVCRQKNFESIKRIAPNFQLLEVLQKLNLTNAEEGDVIIEVSAGVDTSMALLKRVREDFANVTQLLRSVATTQRQEMIERDEDSFPVVRALDRMVFEMEDSMKLFVKTVRRNNPGEGGYSDISDLEDEDDDNDDDDDDDDFLSGGGDYLNGIGYSDDDNDRDYDNDGDAPYELAFELFDDVGIEYSTISEESSYDYFERVYTHHGLMTNWFCTLCQCNVPLRGEHDHSGGRRHTANLAMETANRANDNNAPAVPALDTTPQAHRGFQLRTNRADDDDDPLSANMRRVFNSQRRDCPIFQNYMREFAEQSAQGTSAAFHIPNLVSLSPPAVPTVAHNHAHSGFRENGRGRGRGRGRGGGGHRYRSRHVRGRGNRGAH